MKPVDTPALKAVEHILLRIHRSAEIGWYMGWATESFDLLAAAYGAHTGQSIEEVQNDFAPVKARDPEKDLRHRIAELEAQLERLGERPVPSNFTSDKKEEGPTFGPRALTRDQVIEAVLDRLAVHAQDSDRCIAEIAALFDATDLPISLLVAS